MTETRDLRSQLLGALNGKVLNADVAWGILRQWDAREAALREIAEIPDPTDSYVSDVYTDHRMVLDVVELARVALQGGAA